MSALARPSMTRVSQPAFAGPGLRLQRKCACGGATSAGEMCSKCDGKLQTKLAVGTVDDPLEQEADRIADRVIGAKVPGATSDTPVRVQLFLEAEGGEAAQDAPLSVERALVGNARPLAPPVRHDMEERFGHDFSQVRIYSGAEAAQSVRDVDARAYTVGNKVVFGADQYSPHSNAGRKLIAHELVHVIQQSSVRQGSKAAQAPRSHMTQSRVLHRQRLVAPGGGPGNVNGPRDDATSSAAAAAIDPFRTLWPAGASDEAKKEWFLSLREADYALADYRKTINSSSQALVPAPGFGLVAGPSQTTAPATVNPAVSMGGGAAITVGIVGITGLVNWLVRSLDSRGTPTNAEAVKKLADALLRLKNAAAAAQRSAQVQREKQPMAEQTPGSGKQANPSSNVQSSNNQKCSAPTGETRTDPIEMKWFKPLFYYPEKITLADGTYYMTGIRELPGSGHDIGVDSKYMPFDGKVIKKIPNSTKRRESDDFREHLALNEFNWDRCGDPPAFSVPHDVDHVLDLVWSATGRVEDNDNYSNLWPLESVLNREAGRKQNQEQMVEFCEERDSSNPARTPIGDDRLLNRWFVMRF